MTEIKFVVFAEDYVVIVNQLTCDVCCGFCVKPCHAQSGDNVDELKDVGFPISEKISRLGATLAVQLPKCNCCHFITL